MKLVFLIALTILAIAQIVALAEWPADCRAAAEACK